MPKVFRIGYIELATPDVRRQAEYYENVIGLRQVEASADAAYLSIGLDHHNVALRSASAPGLSCIGLQVNQDVPLKGLARDLEGAGHRVSWKKDSRPGVSELIEVTPPGSIPLQLFSTMTMPAPGFSEKGIRPIRLGHVAIMAPDAAKVVRFFTESLGFHTTDWFVDVATFLTCNPDHHVLNVVQADRSRVHHIAFQIQDRSHHCQAADLLATAGISTLWGPARHTAGHNFAAYHHDPDRTIVELYTDMDVLLPDIGIFEPRPWHEDLPQKPKVWQPGTFNTWGTRFEFDFSVD
ncbi:VOC family protein [Bradyrhizobium sp. LB11.1]|uniref:VOC family protein n=1 Tax=Bradyrhizobium sp. LB11.1 TaxID=3156326 RepID=UPI0033970E11